MKTIKSIHKDYLVHEAFFDDIISNFDSKGEPFGNQDRNSLKLFDLNGKSINVKSFRIPNLVNQIAYRFFRKSKAQRSFEYGNWLKSLDIGTPQPLAYYEYKSAFLFNKSYYISAQQDCDLTYRELTTNFDYPDHEHILRAFTRFTYKLHKKNVHFLDHSPGNTLIKKVGDEYQFYLVDLNRMEFKELDFETRITNFSKLTTHKFMVEIMSDEYAKCSGEDYDKILDVMWSSTEAFQNKYHRKRRLKNKILFWRRRV
ncbi:Kdo domain containing protein [Psychroserpens sp.]|uniref:Kdo domain containing protein n=1 Tax=Psychroserpens sp. TaxID=2020870 RepID=UPI00385985AC